MLFIGSAYACLRVFKSYILNRRKRIRMMSWCKPGHLWRKGPRIHRQCALHDTRRDGSGDRSAMLTTLHHDRDDIFRLIERGEATEPGDSVFLSVGTCLSRACFSRDLHIFQSRTTASSPILVHHFP